MEPNKPTLPITYEEILANFEHWFMSQSRDRWTKEFKVIEHLARPVAEDAYLVGFVNGMDAGKMMMRRLIVDLLGGRLLTDDELQANEEAHKQKRADSEADNS